MCLCFPVDTRIGKVMLEIENKSLIISSCERHGRVNVNIHITELKRFLLAMVFLLE